MIDSLGGLLTNGLLGNPIIASFNLFIQVTVENVTPTVPLYSSRGHGYGWGGNGREDDDDLPTIPVQKTKDIKITIRFKGKEFVTYHQNGDKLVGVVINIIRRFNKVIESMQNITIFRRRRPKLEEQIIIRVKKHDS